jgi:tripartite-type tricarboxylate transporter receptor subunit TctC
MIRMFRAALLAALALGAMPLAAQAQGWPKGPITVVVPLAAGDAGDMTARSMSVIAAKNDGYTLLFTQNSPLTIRRVLEPASAAYDPLRELAPLAITTRSPSVLVVRKDAPFNSFQELVAHAKKNPRKVNLGNAGSGSAGDLSVQAINAQAGTELVSVPYKGAAPAVTDVLGGQVDGVILALGAVSAHLKSGRLKALAISQAVADLPQVPTLTKLGYKQDLLGVWFAWMMPAGTPPDVAQVLVPALQKATRDTTIAQRLQPLGILQDWEPAPRLAAEIRREYDTVADVTSRLQTKKP